MADFEIVANDTRPVLVATLYAFAGTPQDLSGCVVQITVEDPTGVVIVNDASCAVVDPTAGVVSYTFQLSQTATPGLYYFEFHVTTASGGKLTFPTTGPHQLIIRPRLAA